MNRRRVQLAIQSVMVAVALGALNLYALLAVSKERPQEQVRGLSVHTSGHRVEDFPRLAVTCRFTNFTPPGRTFKEVERVVQYPLPEELLQIWSPVIASASISVLVLGMALLGFLPVRRRSRSGVDITTVAGPSGWWQAIRWATIPIALSGLNVAAIAYRPPQEPSSSKLAQEYFDRSGAYLIKSDGDFEFLRPDWDLTFTRFRDSGPTVSAPDSFPVSARGEDDVIKVTTIEAREDGSVLGHGGRPGEVTSNPIVLRSPLRSPLDLWWPIAASTSITALVSLVLTRRARRNWGACSEARTSLGLKSRTRFRPLIKWAVIGTALAALNGAGAVATRNAQLRERVVRVKLAERQAWGPSAFHDENWGDIRFAFGRLATGEQLFRIMVLPGRPTPPSIFSPIVASVSVTILTFRLLLGHTVALRGDLLNAGGDPTLWRSPRRLVLSAVTVSALIGLNVAGAICTRFPDPGEERPCPGIFQDPALVPDEQGGALAQDRAGRLVRRLANGDERPATAADYSLPLHTDDGPTNPAKGSGARVKDTVVYRNDGSVVAYDGNPGVLERLIIRPRVIQPATRSFLEVWWSLIGSVSTSLVVVGFLWHQRRWRCIKQQTKSGPDVDLAGSG